MPARPLRSAAGRALVLGACVLALVLGMGGVALADDPPTISGTPQDGTVGAAYSYAFMTTGVTTVTDGALPPGLTLSGDGVLSGTPTQAGAFTYTVTATNDGGSATLTVTTHVTPQLSGTPPSGTVGVAYSYRFTTSGTTTVTQGTPPDGLTLSSEGVLSGTPTQAGSSTYTVTATSDGETTALTVTTRIDPAPPTISGTPQDGTVGASYAFTFATTGDPTTSVSDGALPPGLSLSSSGVVSGTPSQAGSFSWTVTATNGSGQAQTTVTTRIEPKPVAPTISGTPPSGTVGTSYSFTFTTTGYPAPTTTLDSGSLPPGLNLRNGLLFGFPTQAGQFTYTVKAANSSGEATTTVTTTIAPRPVAPTFTQVSAPTTVALGTAYAADFVASGTPAPTYALVDAPAFLTIDAGTGAVRGTPTSPGTFAYAVRATNPSGEATTDRVTVTVPAPPAPPGPPGPAPWPAAVTGTAKVSAHSNLGYYVGVRDETWTVRAAAPTTKPSTFKGTITVTGGAPVDLTAIRLEPGDRVKLKGSVIFFRFKGALDVDSFTFTTPDSATRVGFTLQVNGVKATPRKVFTGAAASRGRSPLTVSR